MKSGNGSADHEDLVADRRFTRNPCVTIIHCGEDEIVVKHGSRSRFTKNVRDEGRTRLLGRILRNAVPPASLADLEQRQLLRPEERGDAENLVSYLLEQGILIEPEQDPTSVYLRTILGASTPLAGKSVAILGAGPLGSRIASDLGGVGIGRLWLMDGRRSEAGKPYVDSLAQALGGRTHGTVEVAREGLDDEAAVAAVVAEVDFAVAAMEQFSARTLHLINSVALAARKPWISVYIDGSEALVGPIYVPGESCCYNEFEIQHEATLGGMKDDYLIYKETLDAAPSHFEPPVLPPYLSVASGLAVSGVMRFLLSGRSFLVGRANRFDFERLSIDYEEVLRLPRCPACALSRPGYRALFM